MAQNVPSKIPEGGRFILQIDLEFKTCGTVYVIKHKTAGRDVRAMRLMET